MQSLKGFDLKKLFKITPPATIGLDVGSTAVKIVQLNRNGDKYKVVAACKSEIESGPESSGKTSDISLAKAILDCYEKSGVQTRFAVCGICGPEVAIRDFKFPMLPQDEIAGAVQLEAEQVCPFNVAESVVDYQIVPDDTDNLRGMLVAAANKAVRHKAKIVKDASLNPVLMDVDGLALCNCFNECETSEPGNATAILNVGNMHTILAIVNSDSIPFIRDISHSGNTIRSYIAEQTGISPERVSRILFSGEENIEIEYGFQECFELACQPLVDDVSGTLRYYTAQKKISCVEKVLVCGGFALARGFADILAERLTTFSCIWNPFEKMDVEQGSEIGEFVQAHGCEMAVAAGLAMRSL
ncbi:MAG: type IV pilus assembly protein PilM [Phycisphaerae bacterium]